MVLHLGHQVSILTEEVVAILNFSTAVLGGPTREFLDYSRSCDALVRVGPGPARSVVVTPSKVFLSPVSCPTLADRAAGPRVVAGGGRAR